MPACVCRFVLGSKQALVRRVGLCLVQNRFCKCEEVSMHIFASASSKQALNLWLCKFETCKFLLAVLCFSL